MRRATAVVGFVASFAGLGVTGADGAANIGSNLLAAPDNGYGAVATYVNKDLPPGSEAADGLAAPFAGVVTGWAVRTGGPSAFGNTLTPRVIAGNQAIATGTTRGAPIDAGIAAYPERLPIAPGQLVGVRAGTVGAGVSIPGLNTNVAGAEYAVWTEPFADGENRPPDGTSDTELLLQAMVEPDADVDGFGDETQDGCLGVGGSFGGCPTPVDPAPGEGASAPETWIDSRPAKKITKSKAKFGFTSSSAGSTFECALDQDGFKDCASPHRLKRLPDGKHRFRVRAISAEGLIDRSPAEHRFKVKLPKR